MGANTKIQWCDYTFNCWRGCQKVSQGCANCYADTQAKRNPGVLGIWGPEGSRVVASESMWKEPLKWNRDQEALQQYHAANLDRDPPRPRVFCASMADVFEDWTGPMHDARGGTWSTASAGHWWNYRYETTDDDWGVRDLTMDDVRRRLFRLIEQTPNLDWLLLTKRPENILKMAPKTWRERFPDNVWIGTSVEDQETATARIPHLLKVPARVRFLSMEPLLGPVDVTFVGCPRCGQSKQPYLPNYVICRGCGYEIKYPDELQRVQWVIVGGESGPKARTFEVDWCRSIIQQCKAAEVPVFVKQMGFRSLNNAECRLLNLRDPKGGDMEEWPEDLRVRELPK